MQRIPSNSLLNLIDEPDGCAPLNAVIVYEDVTAGQHAMRTLAEFAGACADGIELHPRAWRLDLLEDPDWRNLAAADVIKADIVIISTSSDAQLSPIIESWVKACLARKRGETGAVVALAGAEDGLKETVSPHFEFLKRAADEAGLDFFSPLPGWEDSLNPSIEGIHRRAEVVTRHFDEILHAPAPR